MKKFLISLLLVGNVAYAMTFEQATEVYQNITMANHINPTPSLHLKFDSDVNADYYNNVVEINTGMLKYVKNNDELGLVLGHELGHYLLHHRGSTIANEFAADMRGASLEDAAGYNHCVGILFFLRLREPASGSHPSSADRLNRLKCS